MKYTIEVDNYTHLMILALIAELSKDDKKLDEEAPLPEFFVTRYSPQVINWVLFYFGVHIDLLVDSGNFNKNDELWSKVMKGADDLADGIRAQIESEPEP